MRRTFELVCLKTHVQTLQLLCMYQVLGSVAKVTVGHTTHLDFFLWHFTSDLKWLWRCRNEEDNGVTQPSLSAFISSAHSGLRGRKAAVGGRGTALLSRP